MIDNAEDLDIAMLMCNLIENSKNYRKTTGSLRNYYREELSDATNNNNSPNEKVITSKPFKHNTSITGGSIDYNVAEEILTIKAMKLIILLMMQIKLVQKKLKLLFH